MQLKDILETFNYQVSGGSDYQWQCYGPNARFMDFTSEGYDTHGSMVFDSVTQQVYEVTVEPSWNENSTDKPYRYIDPEYIDAVRAECIDRDIDFDYAWDGINYVTLETETDFLTKAKAIFNGQKVDPRVEVPLDLDNAEILALALEAHRRDITLNKMVEIILQQAIDREKQVNGPVV